MELLPLRLSDSSLSHASQWEVLWSELGTAPQRAMAKQCSHMQRDIWIWFCFSLPCSVALCSKALHCQSAGMRVNVSFGWCWECHFFWIPVLCFHKNCISLSYSCLKQETSTKPCLDPPPQCIKATQGAVLKQSLCQCSSILMPVDYF